jgi:hypothetical protein
VVAAKAWNSRFWPMALKPGEAAAGDPTRNLWAKNGPLDKHDQALAKRTGAPGRALEIERASAAAELVGEKRGYYLPSTVLNEKDAERTTGVDLNRNGKIDANLQADFLSSTTMGPNGRTTETMNVGWWENCKEVNTSTLLFKQPKRDVTLNGVLFTRRDIEGLLAVVADSMADPVQTLGSRFDNQPDVVKTSSGEVLRGKISGLAQTAWEKGKLRGDVRLLEGSALKGSVTLELPDGKKRKLAANEIRQLAREEALELPAHEYHTGARQMLASGRGAVADLDKTDIVDNARFESLDDRKVPAAQAGLNPSKLVGINGPVAPGATVWVVEREVEYGPSIKSPQGSRVLQKYWIEERDGKLVNSAWLTPNAPDWVWQPLGKPNWSNANKRNPGVDLQLVKELYERSI